MEIRIDPQNAFFRCVEDSSEAIMISDRAGMLLYVNPAWRRIYGFSSEEAIGRTPALLHSGLHSKPFYDKMWAQIRDPQVGHWKGELINRCKDGTLVPVLLTITPVRSAQGEITGYMGVAVDVRFRKELEAKVAHQDRLASVGLLASGIAHEVGTPLGVIRGRAEMISGQLDSVGGDSATVARVQKSLEVIVSQADRISRLIQSLLGMSRSFGELQLRTFEAKQVIDEVLALVGQNLRTDDVSIHLEIEPGVEVVADSSRLQQIVLNLLTNSIHAIRKAMRQGRTTGHEVTIRLKSYGDRVLLSVTDSGCGIPEKMLNEIFKPFFTTKDIGEGTGLGLSIVTQLVNEIDAEIEVRSTEDVGTTFTVALKKA
jgi:PAS domain S-box-containing protein